MPLRAIARLIQTMLYAQRFFPYYVYNILGGIEEDGTRSSTDWLPRCSLVIVPAGTGAVYSFDPVGSYEREACRAAGAAQSLVQPFLDNQVSLHAVRRPLYAACRRLRVSPDLHPFSCLIADIFQEPASSTRPITSGTSATIRRSPNRHRLVHERVGASYRGACPMYACSPAPR